MQGSCVLARASQYHYISHDLDNGIYLAWGRFHTQLQSEDLPILDHLVAHWTSETTSLRTADGSFGVHLDPHGYVQLWIVDSGLRLSPEGFSMLANLVRRAAAFIAERTDTSRMNEHHDSEPVSSMREYIVAPPEVLN